LEVGAGESAGGYEGRGTGKWIFGSEDGLGAAELWPGVGISSGSSGVCWGCGVSAMEGWEIRHGEEAVVNGEW
jgi:hypothetical protein